MGAATLVVTLAFVGIWLRSLVVSDDVNLTVGRISIDIYSIDSHLVIYTQDIGGTWYWFHTEWESRDYYESIADLFGTRFKWTYCWGGFAIGAVDMDDSYQMSMLPLWFIVIPLTLLSAYLLLINPQPNRHDPSSKPITAA